MKKWEYLVIIHEDIKRLNLLGSEGWEAWFIDKTTGNTFDYVWLKRPLPETESE